MTVINEGVHFLHLCEIGKSTVTINYTYKDKKEKYKGKIQIIARSLSRQDCSKGAEKKHRSIDVKNIHIRDLLALPSYSFDSQIYKTQNSNFIDYASL